MSVDLDSPGEMAYKNHENSVERNLNNKNLFQF